MKTGGHNTLLFKDSKLGESDIMKQYLRDLLQNVVGTTNSVETSKEPNYPFSKTLFLPVRFQRLWPTGNRFPHLDLL